MAELEDENAAGLQVLRGLRDQFGVEFVAFFAAVERNSGSWSRTSRIRESFSLRPTYGGLLTMRSNGRECATSTAKPCLVGARHAVPVPQRFEQI